MNYTLIQYISLIICGLWSILIIIGFLNKKAFNPIGKFNKFTNDLSMRLVKKTSGFTYGTDRLWFVSISSSAFSFWIATALNIFCIALLLLLGFGVIYFK